VGIAYMVGAWLLAQVADLVLDVIGAPDIVLRSLVALLILGLVPAVIFAWVFEMTPDGVKRESEIDRNESATAHTGKKLNIVTILMLIAAVVFVAAERYLPDRTTEAPPPAVAQVQPEATVTPPPAAAADSRSIAVLPFVNMSSDQENEYFADGLSEELLNQLAQIPDLLVAGRTSSFSFKGKNEDLRVIGSALGVANVLEGSVRRQGDQVRVTAQMIRVSDGFHLWSNTYDRTMDDVFAIQDDISSNVADSLKIVLDESARQRMQAAGIRNVDAFVEFQKGMELFHIAHGGELMKNLRKGLVHFDRAIELVPEFGAAYWQKSDYYAHVIIEPSSTNEERAVALADLREVLDAAYRYSVDSPRRAFIDVDRVLFSDDWTPLHDRIEKALAIEGCPEPTWIELATGIGHAEAARDLWKRYQRCEPLGTTAHLKRADAEFWLGNYESALEILSEGEVLLGTNPWIAGTRQWILLALGQYDEALAITPDVIDDEAFFGMGAEALPLAMSGNIEGARSAMEQWISEHGRNLRTELYIHAAIGDRQGANQLAAELDARPGGPMMLLVTAVYCACGAPFDLQATPNFSARIRESGTEWPLETHIRYPAKGW